MFDQVFVIEDIQENRIIPNGLPVNFVDLVNGPPAAQFKDKIISSSDWSRPPLLTKQLLYAEFDAYAIFRVYWEIRWRGCN
jgi:ribonuclease D